MVCGAALEYLTQAQELTCTSCGRIEHGHIRCPQDHYTCEVCHNRDAVAAIEEIARATASCDPFEIAERMMGLDGLPFLGCQHAYIAAGALLAALRNEGSRRVTGADLDEVFARTGRQAHGGYCGLSGVCGISPALGACVAVLTGSKCGTDEAQRITMEAVMRVTRAITDLTGPSCCKAYVRGALEAIVPYLGESLGVRLPAAGKARCDVDARHPHGCREQRCPYFASAPFAASALAAGAVA